MITQEDRLSLIDLIEWYRDEYHKKDFGHTAMIENIRKIDDDKIIELYWKITDSWLEW